MASFNSTPYNYASWLEFYHNVNETLGKSFSPFRHGFLSAVGVPNSNGDKGGFVYLTGWEGGYLVPAKKELTWTDGVFAVVKDCAGQRRVVEWRESSNIPNTAKMPTPVVWKCGFTGNNHGS